MKTYKITNLSCASCAAKVESELSKLPQVNKAAVNFTASTLTIDYENLEEIRRIVKKIEPGSDVEDILVKKPASKSAFSKTKKELLRIFIVVFLFLLGMLFSNMLEYYSSPILEYVLFLSAYFLSGWGVLSKAVKNIVRGKIFDENFLMSIATLGAIFIGQLPEAVGVMLFYIVGEYVQGLAVNNSRRSIKALLEIRPDYANLLYDGTVKKVSPEEVNPGDIIIVKSGERIPLDGEIIEGSSYVDTFALTGEPVPRSVKAGDKILSGMINGNPKFSNSSGTLTIKVTSSFSESTISKIMKLVEQASTKKAQTERFITTFARYYTPVVVFVALGIALIPPLFLTGHTFEDWIYRALVILVISCPCALVVSIPLGYFGGIGGASKKGILVKGSNFLDALTRVKKVIFDKTGTLTKGVFKVTDIVSINGISKDDILYYAAAAESHSNHPVAKSLADAYESSNNSDKSFQQKVKNYEEISGQGIKAEVDGHMVIAGNDRLLHSENIPHDNCFSEGTVVHVAIDKQYAGYVVISDELKEQSINAINRLKELGVEETLMLTGDNSYSAKIMAEKLGVDKYYAELLPQDKVSYFEKILETKKPSEKIAFVGDGINDAPVIARADVGIAMGGLGSDAAVEAADIVIMEDDPSKVADAIVLAKKTRRIVWQNITFAIIIKLIFIALGGLGLASMWEAVFADMGVAILAIFNSTRMLRDS